MREKENRVGKRERTRESDRVKCKEKNGSVDGFLRYL